MAAMFLAPPQSDRQRRLRAIGDRIFSRIRDLEREVTPADLDKAERAIVRIRILRARRRRVVYAAGGFYF